MADARTEVEITAQRQALDEAGAREAVAGQPLMRLKRLASVQEVVDATLRYKPYYVFDAVLTKRVFAGEDIVYEGFIVVDALSGISRPLLEEQIELTEERVRAETLVAPDLDEAEALREAKSRRMQVEHRERGEVEMDEEPRTVYKPVWLVELANDDVRVVDATNGRVVGDMVLG